MIKLISSIVLFFGIVSCSVLKRGERPTVKDLMYKCVLELVGKHGVGADKATKACERIYKLDNN